MVQPQVLALGLSVPAPHRVMGSPDHPQSPVDKR